MCCHHFYSMKNLNNAQELRRPTFVKDVIYPTALKSCWAAFTASIFSFKVPSGTHDYSDGFLKNVTIYSGSLSRPGQIRPDSSVQPPKPHVQVCTHPFTFWKLCRGCCKAAIPVCWVVCNVILQKGE